MPLNVASRKQASSVLSNAHKVILTTMNSQHYRSSHISLSSSSSPLAESDLKSILSVATAAAKKAGEIIVSNAGGADVTKTKANPRDLLTMIDPLCEKAIRETVLEVFPSHDFLGEEDVPPGKEASAAALDMKLKTDKEFLWIVDVSIFL